MDNLYITTSPTFDFYGTTSNEGKLYFFNVRFGGTPVFNGYNSINQMLFQDCRFFAGYTQVGCQTTLANCFMQNSGTITFSSVVPFAGGNPIQGTIYAFGGGTDGSLVVTQTGGSPSLPANDLFLYLYGFVIAGGITLSGVSSPSVTTLATPDSLASTVTLSGTATTPTLLLLSYSPDPTKWVAPPPADMSTAVTRMAALLVTLNGGNPIP